MTGYSPKLTGTRIRLQRTAAKMLQRDLAARVGVHEYTVGEWERGGKVPRGDSLFALSRTLGVSVDFLLGVGA